MIEVFKASNRYSRGAAVDQCLDLQRGALCPGPGSQMIRGIEDLPIATHLD